MLAILTAIVTVASAGLSVWAVAEPQASAPSLQPQHYKLQRHIVERDDVVEQPLVASWMTQSLGVNVSIGTPPQNAVLFLDATQPVTQLYTGCQQVQDESSSFHCIHGVPQYIKSNSSSAQPANLSSEERERLIVWAKEKILVRDTVSVGGQTVDNQLLYLSDSRTDNMPATGYLGFGLGETPTRDFNKSLLSQMSSQWPQPVLGLYIQKRLRRDDIGISRSEAFIDEGEVTFGGTNDAYYEGDFHWVNSTPYAWKIQVDAIKFNGKDLDMSLIGPLNSENNNVTSSANSSEANGTSVGNSSAAGIYLDPNSRIMVSLPNGLIQNIQRELGVEPTDGMAEVPCDGKYEFTFTLSGKDFTVSGNDSLGYFKKSTKDKEYRCKLSAIESRATLGAGFFASAYSAFRFDPPSVGFAQLKDGLPVLDVRDRGLHVSAAAPRALLSTLAVAAAMGLALVV